MQSILSFFAGNDLLLYLSVLIFGIIFLFLFFRDPRIRFLSTFATIVLLQLSDSKAILSYFGAVVFTGGLVYIIIRKKIIHLVPLSLSPLLIPTALFLLWSAGIGILNVVSGSSSFEYWYRELLLLSPFLLLPVYYSEMLDMNFNAEKFLPYCLVLWWIIIFIVELLKVKENIIQSTYLFQISARRVDPVNGALMIFVFLSLAMINSKKKRLLLFAGFLISVASLLLTFARTSWIACLVFLPLIIFLGSSIERKNGYKFLSAIFIISGIVLLFGYFYIPSVRMSVLLFGSKLISATHLKTDASMIGRYIEWRQILKPIHDSPIVGYGFGANFLNYNWFGGFVHQVGFTHSAYLGILFKSGVIGTILLFTSLFGYIFHGFSYTKNKFLTDKEHALIRAGTVTMLFLLVLGYTGNIFFQREMSTYIPLFWCYCIQLEYKLKLNRSNCQGILAN